MRATDRRATIALVAMVLAVGCGRDEASGHAPDASSARVLTSADSQQAHIREVVAAGGVVDSILPIAEHLRRFREETGSKTDSLRNASSSANALVRRWLTAVETHDTAALNGMLLDRAEFAWIYYPGSRMSLPPYEAPPGLLWGQMLASSDEGARRMLSRYGGRRLALRSLRCASVAVEGANRLHDTCTVTMEIDGRPAAPMSPFGTIVEHRGRFKFLTYANRL